MLRLFELWGLYPAGFRQQPAHLPVSECAAVDWKLLLVIGFDPVIPEVLSRVCA